MSTKSTRIANLVSTGVCAGRLNLTTVVNPLSTFFGKLKITRADKTKTFAFATVTRNSR